MTALYSLLLLVASVLASPAERFPHERHARLFPVCAGCHAGIEQSGQPVFPAAVSCQRCHDGKRAPAVQWDSPPPVASNLSFSHAGHAAAAGEDATCATCHELQGGGRMAVARPRPDACFACHDRGSAHLETTLPCAQCHVPLAQVEGWDAARIAALPRPASHARAQFGSSHAAAAGAAPGTCATCHARESCERCHLNADRVPAITTLTSDARVAAAIADLPARYPSPASHAAGWRWRHGEPAAAAAASCANCHAQPSCTACHAAGNQAIAQLPAPREAGPAGVTYVRPPRVHSGGFANSHEAAAGSDASCLGCHERASCDECHATRRSAGFHPGNFLARHGPEAYGNQLECSSCHNTEVFCRSCHEETGRGAGGGSRVAFHSAAPLWLMGHGQSARQSLESCASCHAQSDCARCHSTLGGWGVNPHGAGFNANRLQQQNRLTCLRCHRSAATGGS